MTEPAFVPVPPETRPYVGADVMFVATTEGHHWAAKIAELEEHDGVEHAILSVFVPRGGLVSYTVPQDEDERLQQTWHWPRRD